MKDNQINHRNKNHKKMDKDCRDSKARSELRRRRGSLPEERKKVLTDRLNRQDVNERRTKPRQWNGIKRK